MGTPIEITVFGTLSRCRSGTQAAFAEIARIESLLSIYRPDSELTRFNRTRDRFVPLSAEVGDLIADAIRYAEITDGAFDPTLGPLIRLWGFGPDQRDHPPHPPSPDAIASTLQHCGFKNLTVCHDGIARRVEGMAFNLGGMGKGYAMDRAVQILQSVGIARGMVHCGSTTRVWGDAAWPIAVRHPRKLSAMAQSVSLRDAAIATSGDYEQYFIHDGQRYSHLIDPRSGYPARAAISATVTAKSALAADILSTAAFIRGEVRFLSRIPDTQGWVIGNDTDPIEAPLPFSRRHFLAVAASVVLGLFFPWRSWAATVYMTEEEALRAMMPEATRFDLDEWTLSATELEAVGKRVGRPFSESHIKFYIGRGGEAIVGRAITLDVIGKERPITFLIGIAPTGAILGVEVLIYRESEGGEVRYPRFMRQFLTKTGADVLRLGQDIQPVSGATLSSRAAVHAVRRALSLFAVRYRP